MSDFLPNALAFVVKYDQLADVLPFAVVFAIVGILILAAAYFALHLVAPFSIRQQIERVKNPAVAVILASLVVGIAIIVAAAV